jgi:hypothetical protein
MALYKGRVNPLNVVGQRKLSHIPPHFSTMKIANVVNQDKIDQWIYNNLNSRYCVRITQSLNEHRKIIDICEIGIEDSSEITMLGLACPFL